jgi:uncharacterized membrane-anchored protein YitT (DUF2179 family)
MTGKAGKTAWSDWLMILLGTGLMAIALKGIYDPMQMVTGGFTGIAIIIKEISNPIVEGGVPLWLTNLVLNVPLFLLALRMKGKAFIARTAVATILLSAWLLFVPEMDLVEGDMTLAALFGGVLMGAGIGMILMARATTGGTDTMAVLIQQKLRHYTVPGIIQVIDGAVVLLGLSLFGIRAALYAIVAIFVTAKLSDAILEGFKFSKAVFIVSERHEEVAMAIMEELGRGVTALDAKGLFSGANKQMLYCVVSKKQIVELKDLVLTIDSQAFVIVSDAREVLGEGFIEYGT